MADYMQNIMFIASVITSIVTISGIIFAIFRWFMKQQKQDSDILSIKEEQALLTKGVLACLKGLNEQGCDGCVTDTIAQIEAHINKQAHK